MVNLWMLCVMDSFAVLRKIFENGLNMGQGRKVKVQQFAYGFRNITVVLFENNEA